MNGRYLISFTVIVDVITQNFENAEKIHVKSGGGPVWRTICIVLKPAMLI